LLSKFIPKTSKYHYRFLLSVLFISVSFVISIISIFVSTYYQLSSIDEEYDNSAKNTLIRKKDFLYKQTSNFENYLTAIDMTPEFDSFIKSDPKYTTHAKEHITSLMMAITRSNSNIMQFRFIESEGYETIRIDRSSISAPPYRVDKEHLQNKAGRYYFKELNNIAKGKTWFSNIDLNIEHKKIVKPITPTLRIGKAYYFNNEFKGILIINIFMENILNEVMESELFHVAIIDKDSYILTSNIAGYEEGKKEWAKYLKPTKGIKYSINKDTYRNNNNFLLNLFFKEKYFSTELCDIIQNNEGLKLVIKEKIEKLIEHTEDITHYIIIMSLIVFSISFPIAIILSQYPLKLHEKLEKFKDALQNQLKIVDKYVCMSSTDIDGNITYVSTAFTKLSGYTRDELIGQNHRILKNNDTPSSVYKKMWDTILSGKNWTGLLKNIDKNGATYWVKNHITPIFEDNNITGFTSIKENITDQKLIEEISIKDELTQAYNRRFFNQIFSKELKRARRKGDMFCIAMFDIDYFKKYNDTYGHLKGDEALQKVVTGVLNELQRPGDYLFRVGGEEFIIIYSEMQSFAEAKKFSNKLIMAVEDLKIEHKASLNVDVLTISLGLLTIIPPCFMDNDNILQRIDELLYQAKENGRNQIISQEC